MDPVIGELIKTLGLPLAIVGYLFWKGSGDAPLWVFGSYFRQTIKDRDRRHAEEMERRDKEYEATIMRLNVDIANERNRGNEWQQRYLDALATAHQAVSQTVEVVKATSTAGKDGAP